MDTALSPKMLRSQIIPSTNDNTSLGISSIQLRKSASNDDLGAAAADATHSIFSFLTATARAKSIRVDEFDGDAEEDNFEEDEETDSDLDNEEEDNEEEDDEEEELEEGAQLPPDSEGSAEPDNVELPQLSQASENLHKPDSHLSRATVDSMQNSILYKTKSKNKEVKDKDLDSDRKDMAVDVERQHKIKPWTPSSSLLGSVYSLKKVPSRLGAPRANALTDKLKSQLGIEDDDQLIGGKLFIYF